MGGEGGGVGMDVIVNCMLLTVCINMSQQSEKSSLSLYTCCRFERI